MERWDAVVVGGGFYGLFLAEFLATRGLAVLVCEQSDRLMGRASYANQARVHNGYHYPRSVLTALRSRVNFPRFVAEFGPAICSKFIKVYAVPRRDSKVTAAQFAGFMSRIGAPVEPATPAVRKLFDAAIVEEVFRVEEYAFDSPILARVMIERAERARVTVRLQTEATRIRPLPDGAVLVTCVSPGSESTLATGAVVGCGYARTNALSAQSGLPLIPLKHELAEMALIRVPAPLADLGVTLVDGPFFSCMPFPSAGLHTLSHVRYTPHGHWHDGQPGAGYQSAYEVFDRAVKQTAYPHMVRDAARFLPALARSEYQRSLWEVKTVLPRSETDDSRPILFRAHHGIPNYHVVMGGKIDNVYDVCDEIVAALPQPRAA